MWLSGRALACVPELCPRIEKQRQDKQVNNNSSNKENAAGVSV